MGVQITFIGRNGYYQQLKTMGGCIGNRNDGEHHNQPTTIPKSQTAKPQQSPKPVPKVSKPAKQLSKQGVLEYPNKFQSSSLGPKVSKIEINISTNKDFPLRVATIEFDQNCHMIKSYVIKDKISFWKVGFNWHSVPIKSKIDIKTATVFSVKNCGIKYNHFIVGVIRETDLHSLTNTPWKTDGVICYQSCGKAEGSWMRHGEGLKLPVRDVKNGQTLSVVVRSATIQFWINQQFQVRTDIPVQYLSKPFLPYIATFCSGDYFQLLPANPLNPYKPPS